VLRRLLEPKQYLVVAVNSTVRYGANGSYVTKQVSGGFLATNDFFGKDPAYGIRKEVSVLQSK